MPFGDLYDEHLSCNRVQTVGLAENCQIRCIWYFLKPFELRPTYFRACLGVSTSRLFPAPDYENLRVFHPFRVLNLLNQDFAYMKFAKDKD